MPTKAEIAALARGFRDGDSEATRKVERRVVRIVGFRAYSFSAEDRSDIVQTVLAEMWQLVSGEDFQMELFWAFVEVVASRRCVDRLRARKPVVGLAAAELVEDPDPSPFERAVERERRDLAEAALSELSPACRELLEAHYRDRLPYAELARRMGKSEVAVRVQAHRCVRKAAEILERLLEMEEKTSFDV